MIKSWREPLNRASFSLAQFCYRVGVTLIVAGIVILFAIVIAKRLATVDLSKLNLTGFDFSQLLALLLALFAMALSAQFYFKAADTSNAFYNNTYNFMKDVSEVLGRMEERFGKQLEGLEKAQTRIEEGMKSKEDVHAKTPQSTDIGQESPANSTQEEIKLPEGGSQARWAEPSAHQDK
jgi:hypothetical protein